MPAEIMLHSAAYGWLCDLDKRQLRQVLEAMQADSERQQAEMAAAAREKEALVAENDALQQALAQERAWRAEALTRLDALIQAVEEQDSAE